MKTRGRVIPAISEIRSTRRRRLELIEDLAPSAMDQANADAFNEAHKDLEDMLNKVSKR